MEALLAQNGLQGRRMSETPVELPALWRIETQGSPFCGAAPLEALHAPVFFGRTLEVEYACECLIDASLRGAPFLLIRGPAGTGKSSLARAGVIPRLTEPGTVPDVDAWQVTRIVVGLDDLAAIADLNQSTRGRRLVLVDQLDRKSTRLNSSHVSESRMPSSA